jgi:hypothetical protein
MVFYNAEMTQVLMAEERDYAILTLLENGVFVMNATLAFLGYCARVCCCCCGII